MFSVIYLISLMVGHPSTTPILLLWALIAVDVAFVAWFTWTPEKE